MRERKKREGGEGEKTGGGRKKREVVKGEERERW